MYDSPTTLDNSDYYEPRPPWLPGASLHRSSRGHLEVSLGSADRTHLPLGASCNELIAETLLLIYNDGYPLIRNACRGSLISRHIDPGLCVSVSEDAAPCPPL